MTFECPFTYPCDSLTRAHFHLEWYQCPLCVTAQHGLRSAIQLRYSLGTDEFSILLPLDTWKIQRLQIIRSQIIGVQEL
jgi:hypothetical protein